MSIKRGNMHLKQREFQKAIEAYRSIPKDSVLHRHALMNIERAQLLLDGSREHASPRAERATQRHRKAPLISVIVPIFNVEPYIGQCLRSIADQTMSDLEVLCINDGSTDKSLHIVERYASEHEHFMVVHKPNAGYGAAINCGLKLARGEYVGIVEPDDFISSNMFEELFKLARGSGADVARGTAVAFANNTPVDRLYGQPPNECLEATFRLSEHPDFLLTPPAIWSAIYKTDFLRREAIEAPETPGASFQDVAFFVLTSLLASTICTTWRPFYYYRNDNPTASRIQQGQSGRDLRSVQFPR